MTTFEKINKSDVENIFKSFGVKKASIFGSVARNEDKENSDIDFVVSFISKYDLLDIIGLKQELSAKFNRNIDVITEKSIHSKYLKENIYKDAKVIYEYYN